MVCYMLRYKVLSLVAIIDGIDWAVKGAVGAFVRSSSSSSDGFAGVFVAKP